MTCLHALARIQYGKPLEATAFQHRPADYIYMFLFGMVSMLVGA